MGSTNRTDTLPLIPKLARAVTRTPEVHSGDLVVRNTQVPIAVLLDSLVAGENRPERLRRKPPVIPEDDPHGQSIAEVWTSLREEGLEPADARKRILALADWAWLTGYLVGRLDDWVPHISVPPDPNDLPDVVKSAVRTVAGDEGLTPDQAFEVQVGDWVIWGEPLPVEPEELRFNGAPAPPLAQVADIDYDEYFTDTVEHFWLTWENLPSPLAVPPSLVSERISTPDQLEPFLEAPHENIREAARLALDDVTKSAG